ncbi:MAG: glutathione S-transferase family protein [Solirubrobacteraceae bacterium]
MPEREIVLYGNPDTASTIIHGVLEWASAPHRLVIVGGQGPDAISLADYRELNPLGRVPTIVDGELVLYETVAILEHLVETLPGLGPRAGEPGRPELHFWLAWLTNDLMSTYYRWFKAKQMIAPDGIPALRAGAIAALEQHGEWLERRLTGRRWLVGDRPCVADLFLWGLVGWGVDIDGLTLGGEALAAHTARTLELPGVGAALEQERQVAA